ncbi:MAG: DUF6506 family protein [Ardenticatenaceae bacterium]|nr:DUF6506 family protein [Ardenticatenaceae bacterium]HBY95285.1 hypothetical protein [Chloroflexota bacterium]
MIKWAFIAVSKAAEGKVHKSLITTAEREITTVLVPDYETAARVARELVDDGAAMIELCGGVGYRGVAQVAASVPEVPVGVVRFDKHPALGGKSGDELFCS